MEEYEFLELQKKYWGAGRNRLDFSRGLYFLGPNHLMLLNPICVKRFSKVSLFHFACWPYQIGLFPSPPINSTQAKYLCWIV